MDFHAICSTLGLDPLAQGLQILGAHHLARLHFAPLDPDIPALIARCEGRDLAMQCQRALLLLYPRDHLVSCVQETAAHLHRTQVQVSHAPDSREARTSFAFESMPLDSIAHAENWQAQTVLFVPTLAHPASFNALANVTAHLRAPKGCPWDREQTHKSLRQYLLEECYEVLETIDKGNVAHLREELGDLMSLILLQIQIAYEANEFSLSDVLAEISAKLVRRHPHVFGDTQVNGMDELLANWERIKESEKPKATSAKQEIPLTLPALMRAQKVAAKGKKRLGEKEIERLELKRLEKARDKEKALGEALFALAAYAEANGIDAESALRSVTAGK